MCDGHYNHWDETTILRKKKPIGQNLKKINPIFSNKVKAQIKYSDGNKKATVIIDKRKLDEQNEACKIPEVGLSLGKTIQQARAAKGITQKQLATLINEKPNVIAQYEQGQAAPNNQILGKFERKLGVKLRGLNKKK
jgi:putative transcription factor